MTAKSPKIRVSQLTIYNPGQLSDEEIGAAFVARLPLLARLRDEIAAESGESIAQNHLIVGQRGMGKSMLLARIALEIRTNPELSKRFVPLVFVEEQYSVDRLSKFWLNCLDSLADAAESMGEKSLADRIDVEVRRLQQLPGGTGEQDREPARQALASFLDLTRTIGKRALLLVDNLQLVFDQIKSEEQHAFRELLMRPGAPILIGASPSPPASGQDYGAAFYDQFKTHYLKSLSLDEMRDLLLQLADATGRSDVRHRVSSHPERIKALRELTGGNPRTTVILFFLYTEDFSPRVFDDLTNLLDRVTALYKARFEELTPQQRVIVGAIADHWAPATARKISEMTVLPLSTISSQIDRLTKIGVLETVELHGESSAGHQIAERFFNIWFLMRSSSRRQRREVEFFVRFIESFYDAEERRSAAGRFLKGCDFSPDQQLYAAALAHSLEQKDGDELKRHAELDALRQKDREARRRLEEVIDFSRLAPRTLEFDQLRRRLEAIVPEGADLSPENFRDEVLGSRAMFQRKERERLAETAGRLENRQIQAILDSIRQEKEADRAQFGAEAVDWLGSRLRSGQLRSIEDREDWERTLHRASNPRLMKIVVKTIPTFIASGLAEPERAAIRVYLEPASTAGFWDWFRWAHDLQYRLGWYGETESAYRRAIELNPRYADPWNNLGNLLKDHLGRYAESESAYRRAIELDPNLSYPWNGLGNLLKNHLGRYAESESAYRRAIELDPHHAYPWNNLGNLYCDYLNRFREADEAFTEAERLMPGAASAKANLVFLRRDFLGEPHRAREAFDRLRSVNSESIPEIVPMHEALFAAYDENWGLCREALAKAIEIIGDRFPPNTRDDWFRASAVLLHLNYGENLLEFLRERGEDSRMRPWYEALSALVQRDRRFLKNIPVEVRATAEVFFDEIEKRLKALPDSTRRWPVEAKKPSRRRK